MERSKFLTPVTCIILTFTLITVPNVYADGMGFEERKIVGDYQNELPKPEISKEIFLAAEKSQYCAIDFDNGIEKMALNIDLSKALKGEAFYWLFPVPGDPLKVKIQHLNNKLPVFEGMNIEDLYKYRLEQFREVISGILGFLFPAPGIREPLFFGDSGGLGGVTVGSRHADAFDGSMPSTSQYKVVQRVTTDGVTTDLISTKTIEGITEYFNSRGLKFPDKAKDKINDYIGANYSFVVSYVSNLQELLKSNRKEVQTEEVQEKQEDKEEDEEYEDLTLRTYQELQAARNRGLPESYIQQIMKAQRIPKVRYRYHNNYRESPDHRKGLVRASIENNSSTIGVFLSFPTERMFFPLKPTSIYGDLVVPATILVTGLAIPELYNNIRSSSKVSYYARDKFVIPDGLQPFFGKDTDEVFAKNQYYTKIEINTSAENYLHDLWIDQKAPVSIVRKDWVNKNLLSWADNEREAKLAIILYFGVSVVFISCFVSWFLILRKEKISFKRALLPGVALCGTIYTALLVCLSFPWTGKKTEVTEAEKPRIRLGTFLLRLLVPFMLCCLAVGITYSVLSALWSWIVLVFICSFYSLDRERGTSWFALKYFILFGISIPAVIVLILCLMEISRFLNLEAIMFAIFLIPLSASAYFVRVKEVLINCFFERIKFGLLVVMLVIGFLWLPYLLGLALV